MNILLCGGAGYIGSHALKLLQNQGNECQVLDNLQTGHAWAVGNARLHQVNILDRVALQKLFTEHRFDAVMHFCAHSLVGESCEQPAKYYWNNVSGTLTLLDVMLENGVRDIIFSSTAAVFGVPESRVIDEVHPLKPVNPYGKSKLMIEQILQDYSSAYDLNVVALRYFNAAGADPECEIGELHEPETHLIPNVIRSGLSKHKAQLKVFGDDYETPDGTCIRDYIHVNDIAEAHALALKFLQGSPGFHCFNLGSQHGFSVLEIIRTCEKLLGKAVPYQVAPRRPGDPPILVADNQLAKSVLGWNPTNSELENIIETAIQWEKKGNRRQE